MIIRDDYRMYSREVERAFYKHSDVMDVAIVGFPDATLGEVACACVQLKENARTDIDELFSFVKSRIPSNKVPDKILLVDDLPMTASGKIKKISLQDQIKKEF